MNWREKSGGCLTALSLPFFCLAVFMFIDPPKDDTPAQGLIPGLFFGSVLLLPGLLVYTNGRRARTEAEFGDGVASIIRTHDRFTVAELATKIGRTELEAEQLVHRILASGRGIDLVFHRSTREYLHRGRLEATQRIVEQCPSCGAPTNHEVVFAGERAVCTYCSALLTDAS